MCDEWRNDFAQFFVDMGKRPPGHSLDRIDNNGPYSPDNCRWTSRLEQNNNTRRNRYVVADGQRLTVAEASRQRGIKASTIRRRLDRGWGDARAIA